MRNLIRTAAFAGALALVIGTAPADDQKTDKNTPKPQKKADTTDPDTGNKTEKAKAKPFSDDEFVILAGAGGMYEVALGKVAKSNAASEEVKKFGDRMITDHTKAGQDLAAAAKAANIGFPLKIFSDQQATLNQLAQIRGPDFDRVYMKKMVADHKEDVALFERASKEAKNDKIKSYASKTLPTLKEHLKMAQQINAKVNGGKTTDDNEKKKGTTGDKE